MAKRASKVLNVILNVLLVIALIITAYFIFYTFTHFTSNVQGPSMIPTFNNESGEEDRVLASKIASYTYGDIVILRVEEEGSQSAKDIIKRVYAFGGDSIDMVFENHNLTIYVNGNIVEEKQYESPIYYEEAPLAYVNFCVFDTLNTVFSKISTTRAIAKATTTSLIITFFIKSPFITNI